MQKASFARGLGVAGLGKTEEVFHLQQETSVASPCSWGRSLMVQETKTPTGPYPLGTLPPPKKKKNPRPFPLTSGRAFPSKSSPPP